VQFLFSASYPMPVSFLKALLMGNAAVRSRERVHPEIKVQILNVHRVWRNKTYRDFGLERIIRLFLVCIQFFFPGLYIRHFGGLFGGFLGRRLATELYILGKLSIPMAVLVTDYQPGPFLLALMIYLMLETMLYLSSLIFLAFEFSPTISYRRSLISIFINFLEISFSYGTLYLAGDQSYSNFFSLHFDSALHAVFFSFITSATVGYGDIFPVHPLARTLVLSQVVFSFIFIGLIFNYFSSRAHERGEYSRLPSGKS
jgi:hypothetical protein